MSIVPLARVTFVGLATDKDRLLDEPAEAEVRHAEQRTPLQQQLRDVALPHVIAILRPEAIREHPQLTHLHVILHTSLSGVFNKAMVQKVGANDFLPKWEPDTLAMIVQEHLKLHADERAARA